MINVDHISTWISLTKKLPQPSAARLELELLSGARGEGDSYSGASTGAGEGEAKEDQKARGGGTAWHIAAFAPNARGRTTADLFAGAGGSG